jgi:hypothetical protein
VHEETEEQLQKSISAAEERSAELRRYIETARASVARHEAAEIMLEKTVSEYKALKVRLDRHSSMLARLGEMGNMLRACIDIDEAVAVVAQHLEHLFPHHSGLLYIMSLNKNILQSVFAWGIHESSKSSFEPDECFSLRRSRIHSVNSSQLGLLCKHIQSPASAGFGRSAPDRSHRGEHIRSRATAGGDGY